jgi:antitoxin component YwqK of YwqJK toxin-antitoxin module
MEVGMHVGDCYWNKEDDLWYEDSSYKNKLNGWVDVGVFGNDVKSLFKDGKEADISIAYYETGEIKEIYYRLNEKGLSIDECIDQNMDIITVNINFHRNRQIGEAKHQVNNMPRGIVSTYNDQGVLVKLTDWNNAEDCDTPSQVWEGEALKEKILMDEVNKVL